MSRHSAHGYRVIGAVVTSCLVAACSIGVTAPVSLDLSVEEHTTTSSSTTTSVPTTTSTTTTSGFPPNTLPVSGALVTPSGVVVAILESEGRGFRVRTPCGEEVTIPSGTPVGDVDVVLDPGHGGATDPGAPGRNGLRESDVNLRVAREVSRILTARGIRTLMTRTADYSTTIGVRSALADASGAGLMVSIHHNAPTHIIGDEPGTEVFVQHDSTESRRLGGLLYQEITSALDQFDIPWATAPDAGVLEVLLPRGVDAYGMLRTPRTVTALAELGYMSHPPEAELFATPEYVKVAGEAVADAIAAYIASDRRGTGFVDEPRVFIPQRGISSSSCEDPDLG